MWIDERAAVAAAKRAIETANLLSEDAERLAHEGIPGEPLFVVRLDATDVAYYLIPWRTDAGVAAVVRVDARSGELLGIQEYEAGTSEALLTAERAVELAQTDAAADVVGTPRCVWRPCRESTTPFRPVFQIPHAGGVLFVDMSGAVHTSLTALGRGGGGW